MKKITQQEWRQVLLENPSHEELIYLIEHTDKKDEAWEQLLWQNPSNYDLEYIIDNTDKKEEAQKMLHARLKKERMIDIIKER
jgi:hypothetical protein